MALELFSEEADPTVNSTDLARMGLFTALAIAIHNFPEGFFVFLFFLLLVGCLHFFSLD